MGLVPSLSIDSGGFPSTIYGLSDRVVLASVPGLPRYAIYCARLIVWGRETLNPFSMFPSPAQLNARNKSRNGEGLGPRRCQSIVTDSYIRTHINENDYKAETPENYRRSQSAHPRDGELCNSTKALPQQLLLLGNRKPPLPPS